MNKKEKEVKMRIVVQRVQNAQVKVKEEIVGKIR